jgi:hypothetical protein
VSAISHLGSAVIAGILAWICFRVSEGIVTAQLPLAHWAWGVMAICAAVATVTDLMLCTLKSFYRGES